MKTMTEFLEAVKMWAMTDAMIEVARARQKEKAKQKANRLSRRTRYSVVLKPTIDEDELYTFLNTQELYSGVSRFKAWLVFNWHSWHLKAGMSIQTIILRGPND